MNTRNRKAISPLIATLLLIAIAVAASVLTYSWVMSMVGSQSAQAQTQVRIDSVIWSVNPAVGVHDTAALTVRNTGSIAAEIESISIRKNTAGATAYLLSYTTANSVDQGSILQVTWDSATAKAGAVACPADLVSLSTSYVLRVTTKTGFFYEMVATTPSS